MDESLFFFWTTLDPVIANVSTTYKGLQFVLCWYHLPTYNVDARVRSDGFIWLLGWFIQLLAGSYICYIYGVLIGLTQWQVFGNAMSMLLFYANNGSPP